MKRNAIRELKKIHCRENDREEIRHSSVEGESSNEEDWKFDYNIKKAMPQKWMNPGTEVIHDP